MSENENPIYHVGAMLHEYWFEFVATFDTFEDALSWLASTDSDKYRNSDYRLTGIYEEWPCGVAEIKRF